MGEVTVTATRTEKSLEDVPLSLAVVTAEQIQRSPAVTVADLLKDLPGVQLHEASAPGAPRVYIRGETGNRVLVLVDGRRISEQKSMKGPVLLESAAGVERIEVVQGPASVLYGSEAIAGVVNIITKRSSSRPVSASLDAGYDSATDGWTRQATVSGTVQGLEYRLTGAGADHQDRETPDGTLDNTAFLYEDYSAYAGYRSPSGDLHLGLNVERYRSDVDSWVPVMSPPITYFFRRSPGSTAVAPARTPRPVLAGDPQGVHQRHGHQPAERPVPAAPHDAADPWLLGERPGFLRCTAPARLGPG
jgi:hemoglobin/transferrin/lactoferrin receptor protein